MIQSTNEKNKLTGNYIEKSISSRKNSRNYCEVLSTPKRPNSHSKSNERAKILVHSEKKAKVSQNNFHKIKEVPKNVKIVFLYWETINIYKYLKVAFQNTNKESQSKKDILIKSSPIAIDKLDEKATGLLSMKLSL